MQLQYHRIKGQRVICVRSEFEDRDILVPLDASKGLIKSRVKRLGKERNWRGLVRALDVDREGWPIAPSIVSVTIR